MTPAQQIGLLTFAVVAVLIALTALGEVLRRRAAGAPGYEAFLTRVHAWWAMVILMSVALLIGRTGVVLLFAVVAFAALREFATLAARARGDHLSLAAAFYLILPAQFAVVWAGWDQIAAILVPVWVFLFLPALSLIRGGGERFLVRASELQWGLMVCVFCTSHIPALMMLDLPGFAGRGVLLIAFLFLVVEMAEAADYAIGRRFGRRRIVPGLTPRTWEGALAGVLAAAALGAALAALTPFGPLGAAALAAGAAAAGLAGALVLIGIKRDRGVKDWSHLIPGQGGFLDQMGAAMCAAPVLYHLVALAALP